MVPHIMLDIETLGTKAGCVVLSVGAAAFDPTSGEVSSSFYEAIAFKDSVLSGLTVDPETYAWWQKQDAEARRQAFAGENTLFGTATRFAEWAIPHRASDWWCQGSDFDFPIWGAAMKAAGITQPWKFWQVRDTRTLYAVAKMNKDAISRDGTYHNALDDSLHQIRCVHECYRLLGLAKPVAASPETHDLEDL